MDERDTQPTQAHPDTATNQDANEDTTFRELAMKLIAARYTNPQSMELPKLLVGQLPPTVPFDLPLPEGTRVLGSLLQGDASTATMVLVTERSPDEVVEFYKERLKAAGWSEEEFPGQQRGFVQSGPMGPSFARFLLGDTGPSLIITTFADVDGLTTTQIILNPEGRRFPAARGRMGPRHDMWSALPAIRAPAGAWQSVEGGSGGDDRVISFARLNTALDLSTLAAHYQAQLERGGWERKDAGESGPIAWSAWGFTDTQGEPWRGLFFILKQPEVAERYLLQVSAEWAGTGERYRAGDESGPRVMGFQSHTYLVGHHAATAGPTGTLAQEKRKDDEQPKEDESKGS
ncbi:MAG: hypothetical protein ACXVCX_10510 [Ktedonobacterales bacterium]